jgi:hypothetical protein
MNLNGGHMASHHSTEPPAKTANREYFEQFMDRYLRHDPEPDAVYLADSGVFYVYRSEKKEAAK